MGGQRFHALCQKPLYSGAKPGKAVHVQGAGFQCGGHLGGMLLVIAVHAAAANKERRNTQAGAHISAAGALRSQQSLVPGKAQSIYAKLLHINGLRTGSLSSIHNQ